jgi:hypothetical protein
MFLCAERFLTMSPFFFFLQDLAKLLMSDVLCPAQRTTLNVEEGMGSTCSQTRWRILTILGK